MTVKYGEMTTGDYRDIQGPRINQVPEQKESVKGGRSDYAYLLAWDDYSAPSALYRILEQNILAKVAYKPFTAATVAGEKEFGYGSIIIPVKDQKIDKKTLHEKVNLATEDFGVNFYAVGTGLTPQGIDLGSPNVNPVEKPEAAMLIGEGVSEYEAGEAWFLLNKHLELGVTKLAKTTLCVIIMRPNPIAIWLIRFRGSFWRPI